MPGRFRSIYGAARSARPGDNPDAARRHYRQPVDRTEEAHSIRPEIEEGHDFLDDQTVDTPAESSQK